jgi:NADH-quinone oxidoreductase subunit M
MITSVLVFLPIVAAVGVAFMPRARPDWIKAVGLAVTAVEMLIVVGMWLAFRPGGGVQLELDVPWIPSVGVGYHVGVDGLSLPLVAMTTVLFVAALVFSLPQAERVKEYVALFLFLETACLGVFAALDLVLFFVFWDLTLVGMYFVIAFFGHEGRERAALKFFLYTFLGSLALLLGIIGLFVASTPHTFDMLALIRSSPLSGQPVLGGFVLLALALGFAIKTPLIPFHTWLPPAHVLANAPGSVILAGVMLKMGTYGFVRVAMSMAPEQWRRWAVVMLAFGVASAVWGAFVALGQTSFKRLVAYSSVNHMGYVLLGLGAAGLVASASPDSLSLAIAGAITLMVTHGLITGLLFLLTGVLYQRAETYEFGQFGGLAGMTPVFAAVTGLSAFAALGLPGFAQFVAEIQIFAGSLDSTASGVAISLVAVLVTAGLFLWALHRLFLGPLNPKWRGGMPDLRPHELVPAVFLLVLIVAIGVFPRPLLDVIEPAAQSVVRTLSG